MDQKNTDDREFLSIREFASRTGLSEPTIPRRIKDGSIPSSQPGGRRIRVLIPFTSLISPDADHVPWSWSTITRRMCSSLTLHSFTCRLPMIASVWPSGKKASPVTSKSLLGNNRALPVATSEAAESGWRGWSS